ncbi:hypothetical protein TNCV_1229581 [Trichonephila clavipes]|nr:hypothetical protein TNCV_1229581 [Trichonephila clavipes]
MIQNHTPDRNSGFSATMTFDNALWKVAFIGISSNTNVANMVQIKEGFIRKDNLLLISPPGFHGVADVDEADINTPITVDQHAANCLEEAVPSFTAMRTKCLPSHADVTYRRPLPVFPSCPVLVGLQLPNSHHCETVPLYTSCYCVTGKSSFTKIDDSPPFKLHELFKFHFISSWRLT